MPDTSGAQGGAQAPAGGGGSFTGALKSKFGPLPVWAWLALITVLLLGYALYASKKSGSQQPQQGTPADVGQPGVVVINQDGPEPPEPPGPGPKPPPPPHHPPKEPQTRQITVDQNETLAQLAKQRHWSDATLKQVEEMNVTAGQGEWTGKTKLKKGQTVIRPINS